MLITQSMAGGHHRVAGCGMTRNVEFDGQGVSYVSPCHSHNCIQVNWWARGYTNLYLRTALLLAAPSSPASPVGH